MLARLFLSLGALAPALALAAEGSEAVEENPGYGALLAVVVLAVIAVALFLAFKRRPPRQQTHPRT
jgi:hypothetical protein